MRERRDAVGAKRSILRSGNFVSPESARIAVVIDRHLAEADPRGHPAQEAAALPQRAQRVERLAVEQAEVAGVGLEPDLREAPHERVEPARAEQLEAALARAVPPPRDDHLGPLAPRRQQLGDHLRRVLQVGVHHHRRVAPRAVEPGGQRGLVAERAREVHDAQPGILGRQLVEQLRRPVGRAVVDDDQLIRDPGERRADPPVELAGDLPLVEHRRDDAEQLQLARGHRTDCTSAPQLDARHGPRRHGAVGSRGPASEKWSR